MGNAHFCAFFINLDCRFLELKMDHPINFARPRYACIAMHHAIKVNINTNDTNSINTTSPTRLRGYYSVQYILSSFSKKIIFGTHSYLLTVKTDIHLDRQTKKGSCGSQK